jgi:hypothetical protein
MASNIYSLTPNFTFKNPGIEKKYIQHANIYFLSSLRFIIVFLPLCGVLETMDYIPVLIMTPLLFNRSLFTIRVLFFLLSLVLRKSNFVSLIVDWVGHLYTIKSSSSYLALLVIRIVYLKYIDQSLDINNVFSMVVLYSLMASIQKTFRRLWADGEENKKKMMQEKVILNEIQSGIIIFDLKGSAIMCNHKGKLFIQARGIQFSTSLNYHEIFPSESYKRIENLFNLAIKGEQIEEEFTLGDENEIIPKIFSSISISMKCYEYNSIKVVQMTVTDSSSIIMKRRFLAFNQRYVEETSMILEEEFLDLYLTKQPLKNHHMSIINSYLLSQRNLLVLMDYYLGESEMLNEFFDIKNEVVNTVHICWRSAKIKKLNILLICEQVLPKQVFGDSTKHNQLLKALTDFAILTSNINSEVSINCSLKKINKSACIEYKISYFSKSLTQKELDFIFRIRKHIEKPKILEEMVEINEKYGLGISLFDILLTILGGYATQIDFQDNIYRVIITYM